MEKKVEENGVTVSVVIFDSTSNPKKVLLVFNIAKFQGKPSGWGCPGGGVEVERNGSGKLERKETEMEAAYREVAEETGIKKEWIDILDPGDENNKDLIYYKFTPNRNPKSPDHLNLVLLGRLKGPFGSFTPKPLRDLPNGEVPDVSEARWFPMGELEKLNALPKGEKLYYSHLKRIRIMLGMVLSESSKQKKAG